MPIFWHRNDGFKTHDCEVVYEWQPPLPHNVIVRCLDIGEVGRGVAYALGHANMPGEVTRRAALRGDGLSKMSKLA
jgi:hypothetical protein